MTPPRFLLLLAALPALAPAADIRIHSLQPTVLFPDAEPLAQLAWLEVENASATAQACEIVVTAAGHSPGKPQPQSLPPGRSTLDVLVPDLSAPAEVTVEVRVGGTVLARTAQRWTPQRKWKVHLVKSSHQDIGYEDYLWVKQKEIADFIEVGRRISAPPPPAKGGRIGYRYWQETLLFPRYYAEERGEPALRELIENAVKPGTLPLAGAVNGAHLHWMDYEELARFSYPARRDYKDRFGLDLDTIAIVDNPSFSWSSAQTLAESGFKYAVRFGQSWRTGGNNDYATTKLPPVFWWEGPDRVSRILFAWRSHYRIDFWLGHTDRAAADMDDLGRRSVHQELMAIQDGSKLGPYPWDAVLLPSYKDHETPLWDNRSLTKWRTKYRYPDIRVSDPRDFMVYMEKTHGSELPVLSGDLNNFSADYATIDPEAQGWKRRAARLLPFAEGLAAVAGVGDPAVTLPPREVELAYQRMHDFDEHSWPTSPPAGPVHKFNAQWGKRLEGKRALQDAEALFGRSLAALAAQITTGPTRELAVFNPLAHGRSDLVCVPGRLPGLIDPKTGAAVPVQHLPTGETIFVAQDVPAFGYKTYRIVDGVSAGTSPGAGTAGTLRASGATLENEFYTITFDAASGAVTSIRDRAAGRELVDPAAPYQFNQLVRVAKRSRESRTGENHVPRTGARLEAAVGPLAAEIVASFPAPQLGGARVRQTVRLYAGLKRIDILNDLRHVGALHTTQHTDRYRENLFYAFPLQVENFTARAEYAGGVVRPYDDQLRWGSHDYLSPNRWVHVGDGRFGVTMAVHNAPVVHFGEIRYNELAVDYRPKSPHLYSHAWSNRMAGLSHLNADDLNAQLAYSFTSHTGEWDGGATTKFGWSVASPLATRELPAGQQGPLPARAASFLSVDAPNVHLTVLKESNQPGRGWIVRLVETEGKAGRATVDVSRFPVDRAALCDLVENDDRPLEIQGGKVVVPVRAFGYATVRLFASTTPGATGAVVAATVADDRVTLRWKPVAGAIGYNVFRSADPATPPTAHTRVGRATGPEFTDTGLDLDATYSYHVAAVGKGNVQGAPSPRLETRTTTLNKAPPSRVVEFDLVRDSAERLMVCWRKAPESDVARYLVFRSDRPDFEVAGLKPVAVVRPSGFYLEHFFDTGLQPGTTYHYRVLAEDWAGNRQPDSPVATATTPTAAK
jgi:alpha-mannosidase